MIHLSLDNFRYNGAQKNLKKAKHNAADNTGAMI